ncbi:hypothetical protein GCM10017750_15540 [Streptomyces racemochromogenes]
MRLAPLWWTPVRPGRNFTRTSNVMGADMGVFDRIFRRKEEVVAEPAAAEAGTAEALDAKTEPAVGAEEVAEVGEAGSAAAGTAAAEAVEIPKQQSVEAAADSGAGEGART